MWIVSWLFVCLQFEPINAGAHVAGRLDHQHDSGIRRSIDGMTGDRVNIGEFDIEILQRDIDALREFGGGERLLGLTVCCPMLPSQSPLTTRALLGSFPWRLPRLLFFVLQKVRSAEALPVLGTIPTPLAGRGHSFAQRPITAWLLL